MEITQPILVSPGAQSLSVATLAVVSDGVDIWVALRCSYHQYVAYVALVRQGTCYNSEENTLEQPMTKIHASDIDWEDKLPRIRDN